MRSASLNSLIAALFCLLLPSGLSAQDEDAVKEDIFRVVFNVREIMTEKPLADVQCRIMDGTQEFAVSRADKEGTLLLDLPADRDVVLSFELEGYRSKPLDFQTTQLAGLVLELDLELIPLNWIRFHGTILDADSHVYPEDVEVQLEDLQTGEWHTTTTDFAGNYYFYVARAAKYRIWVKEPQFQEESATIDTDCGRESPSKRFCLTGFSSQDFGSLTEQGHQEIRATLQLHHAR
jgi:hypothetical protein